VEFISCDSVSQDSPHHFLSNNYFFSLLGVRPVVGSPKLKFLVFINIKPSEFY